MLPSTSGGHDPISTARGCDRCFLPGLALDWGRCAKAREEATQGEGEPQNRGSPAVSQPTAGAVQVPPREARGGRMHSFAYSHTGPAGRPRRGQSGDLGARGKEPDTPTRDRSPGGGWEATGSKGGEGPVPHAQHRAHASPRAPLQPDRGDSAPPRPPVPLGLPPCGRLPRWGPTAGSPATAPAPAPPGGGALGAGPPRGRGRPRSGLGGKRWPELGPAQPSQLSGPPAPG